MGLTYSGSGKRRIYKVSDLHSLRESGKWLKYSDTTVFLLPFENKINEDAAGHTWTPFGNVALSTAQIIFGRYSAYFDGNQDFLNLAPFSELAGYNGDLTIFVRFKLAGTPTGEAYNSSYYLFSGGTFYQDPGLDLAVGKTTIWFSHYNYGTRILSGNWTADTNWHGLAITRSGNVWTMWLDGTSISTATNSTAIASVFTCAAIGRCEPNGGDISGSFYGYMKEFAVVKQCLFSTAFSLPGAAIF